MRTWKERLPARARQAVVAGVAIAATSISLVAWAVASPVGASPDDDFHLISAWCASGDPANCLPGDTENSRVVPPALAQASCFAFNPATSASCQGELLVSGSAPTIPTTRGNFDGTYPPAFYAVAGLLAHPDIPAAVIAMRILNALLLVVLATVVLAFLPPQLRGVTALGWLITAVPLTIFVVPSNNPSSWAFTGVLILVPALIGAWETHGRHRAILMACFVVASGMAMGARADAALFAAFLAGLITVVRARPLASARWWLLAPSVVIAVGALVVVTSGQSHDSADGLEDPAGAGQAQGSGAGGLGLLGYNLLHLPSLWIGGFGWTGLGWLDTPMPSLVAVATLAAFVGVVFVNLRALGTAHWVALASVALLLTVVPLYVLQRGGDFVGMNVQPRYIWPLVIAFGLLAVIRADHRWLLNGRGQLGIVGLAISLAHSVALYANLRRYVKGTDAASVLLGDNAEWWWSRAVVGPDVVWALGSVAFAIATAVALVAYWRAMRFTPGAVLPASRG